MKYLLIIFLILTIPAKAQDMLDNTFYRTLMKNFKLSPPRERFMGYSLYSIRMQTDSKGVIVSYEPSVNIDSILLKDIDYAFLKADKTGLVSFKYRKKTLILPVMIARQDLTKINFEMWKYKTEIRSKVVLLSPFIYVMGTMKPIDN